MPSISATIPCERQIEGLLEARTTKCERDRAPRRPRRPFPCGPSGVGILACSARLGLGLPTGLRQSHACMLTLVSAPFIQQESAHAGYTGEGIQPAGPVGAEG